MSSERQTRARRIFEGALDISRKERAHFIDRACGDDEELRAAVERLLRADAAAGDFLREPLLRAAPATPFLPPDRIGPYQLREKIGEGGMGVVYRAVRDDGAFQREVAVKLIVHHAISSEARRRLGVERQILAGLDHPWIAQIFDGGTSDEGVSYMVMEYIDGEPIDQYCDRAELTLQQRIELFRKICSAVHCSHQNLVVHCDLKPTNILVTGAGEPKLLDFGIAKLLQQDTADPRDDPTTVGSRPLTPEYASPEQMRGDALSTVSDVYSLGVLLYKLLAGHRPEENEGSSQKGSNRDDAPPPSVAIRRPWPEKSRQLRGDLDAIVLKALRAEPGERYGSAEQFSEDLGRYLDGFPVLARQGNLRYRAKKFLRRHRAPVAAAAVGIAALSVFAFQMAALSGRLSQEQEKQREVVSFFRLFFERAGPLVSQGRNLTLREAVDQNAEMIEQSLEDQPAVKVEIATVLGDIYRDLGQLEQGLAWSQRALELQRQVAGESSVAYALGLLQVCAALRELGHYQEAEVKTRAGLEGLQARSSTTPAERVHGLNQMVNLLCRQERYQEADGDSATALRLASENLDEASLETLAATSNRAVVLRQLGNTAEALRLYERTLGLYRRSYGEIHPQVALVLFNLSSIQRDQGNLALAQATLEEVDRQYLTMFGHAHYERVLPLVGLAVLASRQQKVEEALDFYRQAIRVATASEAAPNYVLQATIDFANLILASNRCGEAEPVLRTSLEHCLPYAAHGWRYGEVEGLLGECLARQEKQSEARTLLERSYQRLRDQGETDPGPLRRALQRNVVFYDAVGDASARQQAERELERLEP